MHFELQFLLQNKSGTTIFVSRIILEPTDLSANRTLFFFSPRNYPPKKHISLWVTCNNFILVRLEFKMYNGLVHYSGIILCMRLLSFKLQSNFSQKRLLDSFFDFVTNACHIFGKGNCQSPLKHFIFPHFHLTYASYY